MSFVDLASHALAFTGLGVSTSKRISDKPLIIASIGAAYCGTSTRTSVAGQSRLPISRVLASASHQVRTYKFMPLRWCIGALGAFTLLLREAPLDAWTANDTAFILI